MRSAYSSAISTSVVTSSPAVANGWSAELFLRYAAATATTWVALAGAQLIVPTNFTIALAFLALLGVPVSLYLRFTDMKFGKLVIPRTLWNSLTVIGTVLIGTFYLWPTVSEMVMMWHSEPQSFWLRFGAGDSLRLLMQAFLVFAALRSFALISDKDATLTTIPSFSVLLLLIPVHKGIEVVCYFLIWTVVATILFALDHRSELSAGVVARVPAPVSGQDVRLAARSLLTVLGVSLAASIGISAYITSRNPEERSDAETAITSLAARLTQFALSLPDGSVNSGPERQIDFSSGPQLPSHAELWNGYASTLRRRPLHPDYWRLFSLSVYNGSSWSQAPGRQRSAKLTPIDWIPPDFWIPDALNFGFGGGSGRGGGGFGIPGFGFGGGGFGGGPGFGGGTGDNRGSGRGRGNQRGFGGGLPQAPQSDRNANFQPPLKNDPATPDAYQLSPRLRAGPPTQDEVRQIQQFRGGGIGGGMGMGFSPFSTVLANSAQSPVPGYPGVYSIPRDGFALSDALPDKYQFGGPTAFVKVRMRAQNPNLGYIPLLPAPNTMTMRRGQTQSEVRVSFDGAVDAGVMQPGDTASFFGQIPRLREYGFREGDPPLERVAEHKNAPQITPQERKLNLDLPPTVTQRTRDLAERALLNAPKNESGYARAQRLSRAIQKDAVYTLRPPSTPEGRDATDFFLFDGAKRGYCTYFAGALTVLCRAQGIPARVVSGFASPDYAEDGSAIIRDANAHAWTEVWVENWGWAVVDATPEGDRGDNSPTWIESWGDWFGSTLDAISRSASAQKPLLVGTGIGALLMFLRWRRRRMEQKQRNRPEHSELQRREIVAQYERMSRLLSRRFRARAEWETPDEWLLAAQAALPRLPLEELRELTQLYLQAQFSPRSFHENASGEAREAVERVRQFSWKAKTV